MNAIRFMKGESHVQGREKADRAGAHDKGAGAGANTDVPKEKIGENMVLSNRESASLKNLD
jgi:hypothetical protein